MQTWIKSIGLRAIMQAQIGDILLDIWPAFPKSVKDVEIEEKRNCHRPGWHNNQMQCDTQDWKRNWKTCRIQIKSGI